MNRKTANNQERRAYDRRWYADHPEYRARQTNLKATRRRNNAAWLREEKARQGCADCGDHDPVVLDFHHRDPSTKVFSLGAGGQWLTLGRKRLTEEMVKCDVLCANCHRRRHANRV